MAGEVHLVRNGGQLADRILRVTSRAAPARRLLGVATLALLLGVLGTVAAQAGPLLSGLHEGVRSLPVLAATIVVLWVSAALHELAHGLAARAHGGEVRELGIQWRLALVVPYCRVEDYRFLPTVRARVETALAGAVANLLVLVPFAGWWWAGPGEQTDLVASVLVLGTILAVVNLVPIAPLDGYVVLSNLWGVTRLAQGTVAYLTIPRAQRVGLDGRPSHPEPVARRYRQYAVLGPASVLLCAAAGIAFVGYLLPESAGPWRWAGPSAGVVLAIAGMAAAQHARAQRP